MELLAHRDPLDLLVLLAILELLEPLERMAITAALVQLDLLDLKEPLDSLMPFKLVKKDIISMPPITTGEFIVIHLTTRSIK